MVILQFQTTGIDPRVTHFNLYKKAAGATSFTRIVQIPVATQYSDPDGSLNDMYYYTFFDSVRYLESGPSPVIAVMDALDAITITGYAIGLDALPLPNGVDINVQIQNFRMATPVIDGQIISTLKLATKTYDNNGKFTFTVFPNDRIFPSRTFYKVEYLDKRFFKEVLSKNGMAQLFSMLTDVPPFELR